MRPSSSRPFGFVFAVLFILIGLEPWLIRGSNFRYWALGIGLLFLLAALFAPKLLSPLDSLWRRFGLVLHRLTNPLIMAFIYFGAFVPMGIIIKLMNKDLLDLKWQPKLESYWVRRTERHSSTASMSKQF